MEKVVGSWVTRHKLSALIIALLLVLAGVIMIARAAWAPGTTSDQSKGGDKVQLDGTLVCLPHKNSEGPHTLECASGLKSSADKYYALEDPTPGHTLLKDVPFNKPVHVQGTFQEETSDIYRTEGKIILESVKSTP